MRKVITTNSRLRWAGYDALGHLSIDEGIALGRRGRNGVGNVALASHADRLRDCVIWKRIADDGVTRKRQNVARATCLSAVLGIEVKWVKDRHREFMSLFSFSRIVKGFSNMNIWWERLFEKQTRSHGIVPLPTAVVVVGPLLLSHGHSLKQRN